MGTKIYQNFSSFLLILSLSSHLSAQRFVQNEGEEEEEIKRSDFPNHFFFGTATSSYQVEGVYLEDGRGISNWDVFSHTPGKVMNNDTGDVADDHYHRFLEDIELIHSMGMSAYRFSISWTRILPKGRFGKVDKRGITFYKKIIDHLLLKEFGERVKYWTTINEPNLVTTKGYLEGIYPPGRCSPPFGECSVGNSDIEPLIAMHNMLLAHANAVRLYRTHFQEKQGGFIGIVATGHMFEPLTDHEFDKQAADRALVFNFAWMYDPIVYGDYPKEMRETLGSRLPSFSDTEKNITRGSLDYIAVNHYTTFYTKDCLRFVCSNGANHPIKGFLETTPYRDGVPIGEPTGVARFFVVPRGLEKIINYVKERYPDKPIFITENGYSNPPGDKVEDMINDSKRVKCHKSYLASLAKAMRNGADVRGYFVWSLMDNFEWIDGYGPRFGLLYVDRQTLDRRPKLSAHWFSSFLGGHLQRLPSSSSILNANAFDSHMDA